MKFVKNLFSAVMAGIMISFGGAVYLACTAVDKAPLGAVLFSLGLTVILLFGFLLFTGKTAYLLENKLKGNFLLIDQMTRIVLSQNYME